MLEISDRYKTKIYKIFDFIIAISLAILVIRKGGFYKSDCLPINLIITLIGAIYVFIKAYFCLNKKSEDDSLGYIALFILSIAYFFPIVFDNYTSFSDAMYEFIRYFDMFLIYIIVKNSNDKKIYLNLIIFIGAIECLIGIDQISNRYLNDFLSVFNSGYLSHTLDRMSSTIQYANTLAIILCVGIIILIKKIDDAFKNKKMLQCLINTMLLNLFFTSLILTKTRFAWLTLIIGIIFLIKFDIKNKSKIIFVILFNLALSLLLSNIIFGFINTEKIKIYFAFFIFYILYFVVLFILNILLKNLNLENKLKKYKNKIIFIVIFCTILYLIFAFNFTKRVILNEKNNMYTAYFYENINSIDNKIDINLSGFDVESEYRIDVFKITSDNKSELFKSVTQEDLNGSTISVDLSAYNVKDCSSIKIDFKLEKGNINIDEVLINGKKIPISYYLIPYEIVTRFKESLNGNDSMTSRFTYLKDAFKIITSSKKNFIFGNGGEAFRNRYNEFKTQNYSSTEVHNSYVQIFCEAGVIGFIIIISIIFYNILKAKKDYKYIAFLVLILHSIQDLNFSYMIVLMIFGILLGTLEFKKIYNFTRLNSIIFCITLFISVVILYILIHANLAKNMQINDFDYNQDVTQEEIKENIKLYKNRYKLDITDSSYLYSLIEKKEEYIKYLKVNEDEIDVIKLEINEIEKLTEQLLKYNKYNKSVLLNVCNIYIRNMDEFIKLNFEDNYDLGKEYYCSKIEDILDNIEIYYKLNQDIKNTTQKYRNMLK